MNINEKLKMISRDLSDIEKTIVTKSDKKPPSKEKLLSFMDGIKAVLFPSFYLSSQDLDIYELYVKTAELISDAHDFYGKPEAEKSEEVALKYFLSLSEIKRMLINDATAIYRSDPAAASLSEIYICYPGFYAITFYRVAHSLYLLNVPCIPRMICEMAHERTGIDIHPGATIGDFFAIDHGTGIVIGETAVIGSNVRIYQGVTIGAKTVDCITDRKATENKKRHPTIMDDVIIYANATILGGETVIGKKAVIGGNVWITHSVSEGEKIYYKK